MKNYQRLLALTLATSITMTSIASTNAWADISLQSRTGNVDVQIQRERTVMVPRTERYTEVQSRQASTTDIYRDDSADYTCRAYSGMDRQVLQGKYDDLKFKHVENWAQKPESGSIVTGAVAGAALTVVTGGLALVGAAIGGLFGSIFSWFRGGKDEQERELAKRARDAKYDEETLQLNCMENELKKSQIYAGSLPGRMPSGVNTSVESKQIASNSGSGSGSASGSSSSSGNAAGQADASGRSISNGNADGRSVSSSCGGSGGCSSGDDYVYTDSPHYPAPVRDQAPAEDHSASAVSSCFF